MPTGPDGRIYPQFGNYVTNHRSPIEQHWGGWYVTGSIGGGEHMGNVLLRSPQDDNTKVTGGERLRSLEGREILRDTKTGLPDYFRAAIPR